MEIIIRNGSETGQTRLPKAGYIRTTDRSETSNPTAKVYKPICPSETRPYIKKTMPLPKAARSIAPESNRGICARPSPRRTACNGNETTRHGPVPFVVRRFPDRPPRHSLQRQPSDHAPVENITISDAAKIRKSCAAIRTNLNSRPIPPKSQDAEKLS